MQSIHDIWKRIEHAIAESNAGSDIMLAPGLRDPEIAAFEKHVGFSLPEDFRVSLTVHNGQHGDVGLFLGFYFLPLEEIKREWDENKQLFDEGINEQAGADGSEPEKHAKSMYMNPKWIPFVHIPENNYLGIDLDPDVNGTAGQIVLFGKDADRKRVPHPSFYSFLEAFASDISTNPWSIDEEGYWRIEGTTFLELR